MHVQSAGKEQISGRDVLVAMFRETDSHAVYLLEKQGITRLDVVSYISHGVSKIADGDGDEVDAAATRTKTARAATSRAASRARRSRPSPSTSTSAPPRATSIR